MRASIALFIALLIGYSTYWSAYYVKIFHGDDLTIVGNLNDFEIECTSSEVAESYCTNAYRIPNNIFKNSEWLGAGVVISASKYYCAETPDKSINFDDPASPGKRFEIFQTYQTINLTHLKCSSDLIIEAWSRKNATRTGYQEGNLIIGAFSAVERLKTFYQLLLKDLSRLLSILFLCLFFIYGVMSKIFKRSVQEGPFTHYLVYWCLFSFSTSDLIQTILPVTNYPLLMNRITAFFSLVAHVMPLIFAFSITNRDQVFVKKILSSLIKTPKAFPYFAPVFFYFAIGCATPAFAKFFLYNVLVAALFGFIFSIRESNLTLLLFSLAIGFCTLRFLNYPYMPNTLTASYFVAIYILLDFKDRLTSISRLSEKIIGIGHIAGKTNSSVLETIEKEIVDLLESGQVTFLHLNENGGCQIRQHKYYNAQYELNIFERETLPPLFAYVVSNQEVLWNELDSSDLVKQIMTKKENHRDYVSNHFSALPISYGGQTIGAIAFTQYNHKKLSSKLFSNELKNYLDIALRSYSEYLIKERMLKDKSFLSISKRINETITQLSCISSINDQENNKETLEAILVEVNKELGTAGFIASLDWSTRKLNVLAVVGYNDEITNRYLNGSIYAQEENRHGPIPLAINGRKIITIPDVELWKDVFHEYTNYFFKVSKTKSCVAIPIFEGKTIQSEDKVWGALFLEKPGRPPLTSSMNDVFVEISASLSELISKVYYQSELNNAKNTLGEFVPSSSIEKILKDQNYEEKDNGYIIMIDLAGSTRVVAHYGRSSWESASLEIKNNLTIIAEKYNIILRDFKWDAYHFTISSNQPNEEQMNYIIEFITESKLIIDSQYKKNFSNFYEYNIAETPKARVCISYGDISRGINQGATKTWTFTGEEMANVTKLESLCKELQKSNPYQAIFCDESAFQSTNSQDWLFTGATVPSNGRNVYVYKQSWSNLYSMIKKSA